MHTSTLPLESHSPVREVTMLNVCEYPGPPVKYTLSTPDGNSFTLYAEDIPLFEGVTCYEYDAFAHLPGKLAIIVDAIMWGVGETMCFKFTVDL